MRPTWYKVEPYWKASGANKKWKLIIYDAIIRSKLLYGLETIHLTQAMSRKLDAFQMRGLRRILQCDSTFINRRNTNKSLLEEASSIAYPSRCDRRKIIPCSEYHMNRRVKLLGHILRSNGDDRMRQISFLLYLILRTELNMEPSELESLVKIGCIIPTRRRMARERRGAGSSLVNMETQF